MTKIPLAVRKRLILVAHALIGFNEKKITSSQIALFLGCSKSTVRKDFSVAGINCGDVKGYDVQILKKQIFALVHIPEKIPCCVVGLGRLGSAILDEAFLIFPPFKIVAGFDSSLNRVEILRSSFPLFSMREMKNVLLRMKIKVAILTVNAHEAQKTVDILCDAGIKGIINCTPAQIKANCLVENASVTLAVSQLLANLN